MRTCAGCDDLIDRGGGWSAIYGSKGIMICDLCWIAEDELIDEVGTNDPDASREIAALLNRYRRAA